MRSEGPPLLPILRSQHQARLLAAVLLRPGTEHTITQLANELEVPVSTLHREVQRLVDSGILASRSVGRSRLISPGARSRIVNPLTELLTVSYGPMWVITHEFGAIEDVDLVLIFGSWAARFHGEPGSPPEDVDVLVVGDPNRGAVYDAAERAAKSLGVPVNPVLSSRGRWSDARDALIQQIRSSPVLAVVDRSHLDEPDP